VAKRLLTDPSEELRNSLKDLLFKDGSFRWNRLENLLRNAKDSQDYNIEKVVNQAIDFILSNRGTFIRERIIDEVVKSVDLYGRKTWFNLSNSVRQQIGLEVPKTPTEFEDNSESLEHIKNIWEILQNTKGFEGQKLLPLVPQILSRTETQQMGQKIAEGLAQKLAARIIRSIFLEDLTPKNQGKLPFNLPLPKAAFK
jgi:hypothetical protein